jgi:hypothetical protein
MKKYLLALLALCGLSVAAWAVTSGTWMCPGTGKPVEITVNGSGTGMTVTITHNGRSVTVPALDDGRGGAAEFPSPPTAGVEVGGASFRGSYPNGKPKWSERPQGRPWFHMPRMEPKNGVNQAQGDGEGTLPRTSG